MCPYPKTWTSLEASQNGIWLAISQFVVSDILLITCNTVGAWMAKAQSASGPISTRHREALRRRVLGIGEILSTILLIAGISQSLLEFVSSNVHPGVGCMVDTNMGLDKHLLEGFQEAKRMYNRQLTSFRELDNSLPEEVTALWAQEPVEALLNQNGQWQSPLHSDDMPGKPS